MSIDDEVDRLIDERPGKELLVPRYDDPAHPVTDFLFRSGGTTAAYCLLTDGARVVINTGMGYEAPHHKRVFDAVRPGPTPYVVSTQGHVDHLGGVALFREPGTVYVAQANNPSCQHDDARIRSLRYRTAGIWFDMTGTDAIRIATENPGVSMHQDTPVPDRTFEERLDLDADGMRLELIAAVGETTDSMIVWLPSTGWRSSAICWDRCSPTSPTSTRSEAIVTDWWSPTCAACADCANYNPRSS